MFPRRPRALLLVVAAVVVGLLGAALALPDRLKVSGFADPDSESARAVERIRQSLGYDLEPGLIISAKAPFDFREPRGQRAVAALAASVAEDPAVGRVDTAFGPEGLPFLLAARGRETLVLVHFRSSDLDSLGGPIERLERRIRLPGAEVKVDGYAVGFREGAEIAREDLIRADAIAIPVMFALLLLMFRGFAPAAVPLAIGVIAILGTLAGLRLLAQVTAISVFALNLGVLLGLGLATDYGLLLVSRFREEAARHGPGAAAVASTLSTVGRTIAFSGTAIAGAFASLLVFPQPFIVSMGLGGILVAAIAVGAALLAGPALLLVLGARIGTAGEQGRGIGGPNWSRWTGWAIRRRGDVALATVAILVAAAAPALTLRSTFADHRSLPEGNEVREVGETIVAHYSPQLGYPVDVVVPLAGRSPDIALLAAARAPGAIGFRAVEDPAGRYAIGQLLLARGPMTDPSRQAIAYLRDLPGGVLVGGRTAEFVDLRDSIRDRAPLAIGLAAIATLLVLFGVTGSVLIPLKALVFNALGLAAAFGLLVLVFQRGEDGIDLAASVVIVAAVFGLAMDYSILLLSRIVEEHEQGAGDAAAITNGMRRTGPVITRAALLIAVPLLAQATSPIRLVQHLGIGQTLGVLLDVTLIRLLLVPSTMALLGRANWWAPRPLLQLRAFVRRVTT